MNTKLKLYSVEVQQMDQRYVGLGVVKLTIIRLDISEECDYQFQFLLLPILDTFDQPV